MQIRDETIREVNPRSNLGSSYGDAAAAPAPIFGRKMVRQGTEILPRRRCVLDVLVCE